MIHFVFPRFHVLKEFLMRTLHEKLVKFFKSEDGPTAVEYAVMVALIIVVSIAAITTLGTKVSSTFSSAASAIQ
jgi:pilus assembly protein Flp/PilA